MILNQTVLVPKSLIMDLTDGKLQLPKWKAPDAVYKSDNNNLLYYHHAITSWRHLYQMMMIALSKRAMDRASLVNCGQS